MTVRELFTKIGFEVDEAPLEKVEKHLEKVHDLLEAFATAEVIKKTYELVEHFAEFGEELKVSADNIGLNVEALQRLTIASKQSGVSQEEMIQGLARLSRNIYAAKTGSKEAEEAFRKAGISLEQVKGFKTTDQALMALSKTIQGIQDPMKRLGVAQELVGRGGFHMISFLQQGPDSIKKLGDSAERLEEILSGEQVEALEKVAHSLQQFWNILKAVGATIAANIAPVFEELINQFSQLYVANKNLISLELETWLEGVAYSMGFIWGLVQVGIILFKKLEDAMGLQGRGLQIFSWVAGGVSGLLSLVWVGKLIGVVFGPLGTVFSLFGKSVMWLVGQMAGLAATGQQVALAEVEAAEATALAEAEATAAIEAQAAAAAEGALSVDAFTAAQSAMATGAGEAAVAVGEVTVATGEAAVAAEGASVGFWAMIAPLLPIAAAIGLVVVAVHELYAAFTGQKGWVESFLEMIGLSEKIHNIFSAIFEKWDKIANFASRAGSFLGLGGGEPATSAISAGPSSALSSIVTNGGSTSKSSTEVHAPINITVDGSKDPKHTATQIMDQLQNHFDYLSRNVQRSTLNPVLY